MIVLVYKESATSLQKKDDSALKYWNHPSRVGIIIVNPGGYFDGGEDRTSTRLSTLQTWINANTRSNGNCTHSNKDASIKDNDNNVDSES